MQVLLGELAGLAVLALLTYATRPRQDYCHCGHHRIEHTHYRDGDDCGNCGRSICARFRGIA